MALVILIISTALFMFYLRATCDRILQRRVNQEFFHSVVTANQLEFPVVRKALEQFDVPVDYLRVRMQLQCDFLTLTRLLKNAYKAKELPKNEPLTYVAVLMMYFRAVFLALIIAHTLRFNERNVALKLTAILEYFANVLGEPRKTISTIRFG